MKKLLASIALIGVLGAGGILVYSSTNDNPEKKKEEEVNSASANTAEEETVIEIPEAPTERTVDTNGDVPWNYFTAEQIVEKQNAGDVVYLFSDAEAIEKYTLDLAQNPDTTPYDKDTLSTSWTKQISAFVNGVSEYYPDKVEYFAKIEEAKNAMANFNYDEVPTLIEEAKTLRESE